MGYNKDLDITPLPLFLYSTNYTTSHAGAQCDISEIRGNDEQIITGQSRWNPTPEQMMVLEEVYSSGMRTPTTQQIQEIAFKLQKYGRIEGKNVFYWFQNHKSRERQKRRRHNHQEKIGFNNVHEEPLCKDEALGNNNLSVSRRRGDHRVIHTMTCLSSSSTHPQNNYIDHGKIEEYDHRGMEDEKEAACLNKINRLNSFYQRNITSKGSQETEAEFSSTERKYNLHDEEEEDARKSRTLDLFPVQENQEKTGFAEKNTKPNHSCCNYYYYYEFMPLVN